MRRSSARSLSNVRLPVVLALACTLALLALACGGGNDDGDVGAEQDHTPAPDVAVSTPTPGPPGSCVGANIGAIERSGAQRFSEPPELVIDSDLSYIATLTTVRGDIVIELAAADAPLTANNFIFLSHQDGVFFRDMPLKPFFPITGCKRCSIGSSLPYGYCLIVYFNNRLQIFKFCYSDIHNLLLIIFTNFKLNKVSVPKTPWIYMREILRLFRESTKY